MQQPSDRDFAALKFQSMQTRVYASSPLNVGIADESQLFDRYVAKTHAIRCVDYQVSKADARDAQYCIKAADAIRHAISNRSFTLSPSRLSPTLSDKANHSFSKSTHYNSPISSARIVNNVDIRPLGYYYPNGPLSPKSFKQIRPVLRQAPLVLGRLTESHTSDDD